MSLKVFVNKVKAGVVVPYGRRDTDSTYNVYFVMFFDILLENMKTTKGLIDISSKKGVSLKISLGLRIPVTALN